MFLQLWQLGWLTSLAGEDGVLAGTFASAAMLTRPHVHLAIEGLPQGVNEDPFPGEGEVLQDLPQEEQELGDLHLEGQGV